MPRGQKYRFVGYPSNTKGYLFYNPEHRSVFVARFAKFLEIEFLEEGGDHRKVELVEIQPDTEEPQREHEIQEDEGPSTHTLHRSSRTIRSPERLSLIQKKGLDVLLTEETDPRTYREVMLDIDSERP